MHLVLISSKLSQDNQQHSFETELSFYPKFNSVHQIGFCERVACSALYIILIFAIPVV
jgi:hypothetical protein